MEEEKRVSIGAMWIKKDKNGNEYLSGEVLVDKEFDLRKKFVAFSNKKAKDTHPDYKIFDLPKKS